MKQMCLILFLVLSLLGSMLILLSLSIYLKYALDYKLEDASLDLHWILKLTVWERYSVFLMAFFSFLFLLLDVIFVIWFLYNLKLKKLAGLTTSTYKKYSSDIEYQLNDSILTTELKKPPDQIDFEYWIESERSYSPSTTMSEYELKEMISQEFNLEKWDSIYIKSIDECEAIVYHGDQEILIN